MRPFVRMPEGQSGESTTMRSVEQVLGRKRYRQMRWWCSAAMGTSLADQLGSYAPRFARPAEAESSWTAPGLYEVRGAIHIHTTYSDGAGDFPTVIAAAIDADLDFLIT